MDDFETNPIGTEQALREALELLGIKVEGSPVEAWREAKSINLEGATLYEGSLVDFLGDQEGRN